MAIANWVWRETAEVLGVVGIIAGIVFLGYELRQNNDLMAADARANRLDQATEVWGMLAQDPQLVPLLIKDRNDETLNEEEEFRLNAYWMLALFYQQWVFLETPDSGDWTVGQRRNFETYGSLRRTWQGNSGGSRSAGKDQFTPAFVRFYEDNVVNR